MAKMKMAKKNTKDRKRAKTTEYVKRKENDDGKE